MIKVGEVTYLVGKTEHGFTVSTVIFRRGGWDLTKPWQFIDDSPKHSVLAVYHNACGSRNLPSLHIDQRACDKQLEKVFIMCAFLFHINRLDGVTYK